jgi:flagellar motility protein MotE (MotC chaperone)
MSALRTLLMACGVLLLVLLGTLAVAWGAGAIPRERLQAALAALKGTAPAAPTPVPEGPADASDLLEARASLHKDQEVFRHEKAMTATQFQAERAELETLQAAVEARLQEFSREQTRLAEAATPSGAGITPTPDKGVKAVAELTARMTPKDAAQLLGSESEAGVAQILRKMDPKQAGKVMTELVASDTDRARRILTLMKEQRP